MKKVLNIIHIILLYVLTLYVIIVVNLIYTMWFMFSNQLTQTYFIVAVYWVLLLWLYLLYTLIHWICKKTLNKINLYSYLAFFPIFLVFFFAYYIQYPKNEYIPETEFETKLQDINVDEEHNWMIQLWKLYTQNESYNSIISNLDSEISNNYKCLLWNNWTNCEEVSLENTLDIYNQYKETIDIVNNNFLNIVNMEYFKEEIDWDMTSLKWLSAISRVSLFSALDYIEKDKEDEALQILLTYKKLWDKILGWDTYLVWMIVWVTIEWYVLDNLEYVVYNYDLKDENLQIVKKELGYNYDSYEILSNVVKVEYWLNKYWLDEWIENWYIRNSMLFNKEDFFNERRNAWLKFVNWEKDLSYKNYFKRNYLYNFLWWPATLNWIDYRIEIDNLNEKVQKLVDKIEQK